MTNNTPISFKDIAGGPAVGDVICSLHDLKASGAVELLYRADSKLFIGFIQWLDGAVHAYQNSCPHTGTPLNLYGPQFLDASGKFFQCYTHGAQFEPASGLCISGPCKGQHLTPLSINIIDEKIIAA